MKGFDKSVVVTVRQADAIIFAGIVYQSIYHYLCVNTPYRDFLKSYLSDLFEHVPVDGLFLDIHHVRPNANRECVDAMLRMGLDPSNEGVRLAYYKNVMRDYKADLTDYVRTLDKQCSIFYNGGHIGPSIRESLRYNTHLELESLPSGGEWGVTYVGDAPYSPDFIVPGPGIGKNLPATELVMYLKGLQVKEHIDSEVLAQVNIPYFNRAWDHFVSHKHTPSSGKPGYPGIIKKDRAIYFAHPIFSQYAQNAAAWCKNLLLNGIALLLPDQLVKHNGPSSVIAALNDQPRESRHVLHMLHYVPERRGKEFDTIEDILPVYNIKISVRTATKPARVRSVPDGKAISFRYNKGRVDFVADAIEGSQLFEIAF